jgi:hypothetical protein
MFNSLSDQLGIAEDQLRIVFLILVSFVLGYINYFIKGRSFRLWYGLITGVILQVLMYQEGKI